ncbi:MAG: hypothetical protein CUN49_02190 [Candidatus Thermofonsia Clade 1 bacterium]|uniref:AlgX/AlgJ SGNH hydrolase-like domain-containing protein n=1 Tax=Candidatus Thermofonsia Clade 1 bacterium TaxID=2364210 RepID=A0A2M8PHP4_9CHLR|nr:MAG: hypothetical protein CUN49_02190 [Candidatus Thermofonsia Clade 1 bacterium]RMF51776.1 MAG: hypothetical protein D6749_06865 [Chloroflexota bacterium]
MVKLLSRLAILLTSIAITLLLLEIAIRAFYGALPSALQIALRFVHQTPFTEARLAPLPLWHEDATFQMVVAPEARDVEQVGSLSVRFRVSTYAWWNGHVGFRTPPPEDGAVQAVALGDSHTFCFTAEEACWVNLLSARLGTPIANLGQPVTGSESHARRYYSFVANPALGLKQPRLVLWQFFGNDYNDDYGLALLNGTAQTPPEATAPAPAEAPLSAWLRQYSAVFALLDALMRADDPQMRRFIDPYRVSTAQVDIAFGRPYLAEAFDMRQARNREGEQLSRAAILRTRTLVEANGGRFIVLLMPTKEEVYRHLTEPYLGTAYLEQLAEPRLRLLAFCAEAQLTCLDLTPELTARALQGQQLFFSDDIHLNAQGNRAVAEIVAAFLDRDHSPSTTGK